MSIINKNRFQGLIYFLLGFLFSSCSGHKMYGEIELRKENEYYLMNKSTSKMFNFTVKTISISEHGDSSFKTETIRLSPADEMFLGKTKEIMNSVPVKLKYEVTGQAEIKSSN